MCGWYYVSYYLVIFLFKQKTAYEMRISDWSSDVCSSDLTGRQLPQRHQCADHRHRGEHRVGAARDGVDDVGHRIEQAVVAFPDVAELADHGVDHVQAHPHGPGQQHGHHDHAADVQVVDLRERRHHAPPLADRTSGVEGKSVYVRVDLGGRRSIQ